MKPDNDWKQRLGVVYSTDPNFNYATEETAEAETLEPSRQRLTVTIDRKEQRRKAGHAGERICGHAGGSGGSWQDPESEMRGRRLGQGRGDHHPGRPAGQSHGASQEYGLQR